jgi:type II secretory pathway component PulC
MRMMMNGWVCVGLAVTGCAATQADKAAAAAPPPVQAEARPQDSQAPVQPAAETIPRLARGDLNKVLDRGPQDFLASVNEEPFLVGGQFRGWVFRGWRDERFAAADLQAGDVVVRINDRPVERPEQFMAVWESLRSASELTIETLRGGKKRVIRYPIQ